MPEGTVADIERERERYREIYYIIYIYIYVNSVWKAMGFNTSFVLGEGSMFG